MWWGALHVCTCFAEFPSKGGTISRLYVFYYVSLKAVDTIGMYVFFKERGILRHYMHVFNSVTFNGGEPYECASFRY